LSDPAIVVVTASSDCCSFSPQHGFHLARVLATGPRQRQRGQRQQQ
jgi:hypothetical protein